MTFIPTAFRFKTIIMIEESHLNLKVTCNHKISLVKQARKKVFVFFWWRCFHLLRQSMSADGLNKDICRHNMKCFFNLKRKVFPFQEKHWKLLGAFLTNYGSQFFAFFYFLANPYLWDKKANLRTLKRTNK